VGATYALTNTGGRKRVHIYGRTRSEVREKLAQLEHELGRGVRIAVENWTVGEYFTHWLATVVKPNLAPKTYQGYELIVRRHIIPAIGSKKLRTLAVVDVRNLVQLLQQAGLGRRSVQYTHAVLRAGLQNAMRDELVMRNVAKLVRIPAPQYEVGLGLSIERARLLLTSSKADRLHALYVVAVYLGLRRAELVARF
jgi:site-specific recombinase XerC